MLIFALLLLAAFVLGVCLHIVLYGPTAMLPPVWRNLARYVAGVAAVMAVMAVALLLAPALTVWEAFGVQAGLFGMCGLGVAAGYLVAGD